MATDAPVTNETTSTTPTAPAAAPAPAPAPALIGQLPGGELAYHLHVQRQVLLAQGAWEQWAGFLRQRYEIGPADRIDEQGRVWRVPRDGEGGEDGHGGAA